MKIGIIVAMDKELEQLRKVFNDSDVLVQKCGIGKVNAAVGAAEMIRTWKPDVIISSGCAGGNGQGDRRIFKFIIHNSQFIIMND